LSEINRGLIVTTKNKLSHAYLVYMTSNILEGNLRGLSKLPETDKEEFKSSLCQFLLDRTSLTRIKIRGTGHNNLIESKIAQDSIAALAYNLDFSGNVETTIPQLELIELAKLQSSAIISNPKIYSLKELNGVKIPVLSLENYYSKVIVSTVEVLLKQLKLRKQS